MKIFVALFITLFSFQLADAGLKECVQIGVDGLKGSIGHLKGFVEWAKDVKETVEKILEKQAKCDEIPRSDPPTFFEKLKIDACELGVNTAKTYETARLVGQLSKLGDEAKVAAAEFRDQLVTCFSGPEIPEGMIF